MKRRDEGETLPTSNMEGRPKIKTCKVPRICRAEATYTNLGLGEKPRAGVCRAEATCTNSGLGETCKINCKTKRS